MTEFEIKAYGILEKMEPGHEFNINDRVKPENRSWFINIGKGIIDTNPYPGKDFTFNNNYSKIRCSKN